MNFKRSEVWKQRIKNLSNKLGAVIQTCHFPPGIRKWNKIEHQMFFSSLIKKRSGKESQAFGAIVNLVANTAKKNGIMFETQFDYNHAIYLKNHKNLGKWNDIVMPDANEK